MQIPLPDGVSANWIKIGIIATCLCFVIGLLDYLGIRPSAGNPTREASMIQKPRAYSIWVGSLFTFGLAMSGLTAYAQFRVIHPAGTWITIGVLCLLIIANWVLVRRSPREAQIPPSKLVIHSANYAPTEPVNPEETKGKDITQELHNLIRGDALVARIDEHTIRDPFPKRPKQLRVAYSYGNDARVEIERYDYDLMVLPEDSRLKEQAKVPTQLPSKLITHRSEYEVVEDCSMGDDPLGPWKYGYSQGVGNSFNLFNTRKSDALPGVDRWFCPEISEDMGVMHNRTKHTVEGSPATYRIPADMMHVHPGNGGYCVVIRWRCPEDGIYIIHGSFEGLDRQTNEDAEVHIMRNLADLWHTTLEGVPSVKKFSLEETFFKSNDNLDFVVGQGAQWGSDSVGLKVTVKKV